MTIQLEYRVVKVERYIVTRYTCNENEATGAVEQCGEYDNIAVAHSVAYALCHYEQKNLGWPVSDERIKYPARTDLDNAVPMSE